MNMLVNKPMRSRITEPRRSQGDRRVRQALSVALTAILPAWGLVAAPTPNSPATAPANTAASPNSAATAPATLGPVEKLSFDGPDSRVLRGQDARLQLVVRGDYSESRHRDLTLRTIYETEPEGIVEISESGFVTPRGNGEVTVTARFEGIERIRETSTTLRVTDFDEQVPVNFPNQIVPIFTKLGCNGGGCHGKSGGQNGFSLSLLGFYPEEDHEYLVKEGRGRRIFANSPDRSLLLLKATNGLPHGGGQRMERDSYEYRLIKRWMRQGMPYGSDKDPKVVRLETFPRERILGRNGEQQLAVLAHYSDGAVEDVTRMAQFESNVKEMAGVDENGLVRTFELAGDVAVMIRYQGHVDVFRATVPLGVKVENMPEPRNAIDTLVFKKLQKLGIPPSGLCDDSTFLRRVTIDLAGRLPTADETKEFLEDKDASKRDKLIDRLIASTDYAEYFANKWSSVLRNKRVNANYTRGTFAFHDWIRNSLHQNMPYDEFVRNIVAASGRVDQHPPVVWYREVNTVEEQVEDAAQLFLGMRIQCARCHHHPFEVWSQKDYYSFAAFFSRVGRKNGSDGVKDEPRIFHNRGKAQAKNPRSQELLMPAGLGSAPLDIAPEDDPRLALVDWQRDPSNPFFAPALVNRYWKHFFGRGLVEPEDDMRVTNPPTHPDLLKALAEGFIESGFDLKKLVREICRSKTYQLSAMPNEHNANDRQNYSRFYPRRLNAEVLFDSIDQLTGTKTHFGGLPPTVRAVALPDSAVNNYFLTVFGRPMADSSCECERTSDANLAQSLHLMNSAEIQKKLADGNGRAARLAGNSELDDAAKIKELNIWAFSREPTAEETQLALAHVQKAKDKKLAFEDIIWALMNTKEFLFNH